MTDNRTLTFFYTIDPRDLRFYKTWLGKTGTRFRLSTDGLVMYDNSLSINSADNEAFYKIFRHTFKRKNGCICCENIDWPIAGAHWTKQCCQMSSLNRPGKFYSAWQKELTVKWFHLALLSYKCRLGYWCVGASVEGRGVLLKNR